MFLRVWRFAFFLCLLCGTLRAAEPRRPPVPPGDEVRIGVLAYRGVDAAEAEWASVRDRLRDALPGRTVSLHYFEHERLNHVAAVGAVDFIITNPGHYIELESVLGASRLLTLKTDASRTGLSHSEIAAAIVTLRENTAIRTLADLRGRSVAIVGTEGFAGFQLPWRELSAHGIDIFHDLGPKKVVGLPMDNVLEAVRSGEADVGFVRACLLESEPQWQDLFRVVGQLPNKGFPCAASTRVYPNWPIATLRHTSPELAKAVTVALLEMSEDHGPMTWTVPADYQSVHAMFRELRTGPYAGLREPSIDTLLARYWPWMAGAALLLFLWVAYTVHVEQKVQARTAALKAAQAAEDELRARLQHSTAQAEHMARLSVLGEMSSTLAHELNQPLAAIGNYSESLLFRAENHQLDMQAAREAATEIAEQASRAAGILRRIRGFAKKRSPHRKWVAPQDVIADAIALFRGMLVEAPYVTLDDRLPAGVTVHVDVLQLQQVMLNLLKNAYDATHALDAGRRQIGVLVRQEAHKVLIQVIDQGDPIPEALLSRLFEPFFSTKESGLGLGLSICRSIAEAHSGHLDAEPAASGCGMTLTLTLPCRND